MVPRPLRAAFALAAVAGVFVELTSAGEPAPRRFSQEDWVALVQLYARGERAQAIAGLAAWSERDLVHQIEGVEQALRLAERCPRCHSLLDGLSLRAAVMLYWDRDRAEQPPPVSGDVEQPRRCPGSTAKLAGRLARSMAGTAEGAAFARRFFRMVVLQCQGDACFGDGEAWGANGLAIFPKDTDLLVARGSVREETATLGWPFGWSSVAGRATPSEADAIARRERFKYARQDFEDALAIDPRLSLAHLRLGRVLWRLHEPEGAREHLEAARASDNPVDQVYLAHLFLGRVHQDAGRLAEATSEYTLAARMHPGALSGATALSNALLLAGDVEAAREALRAGLANAGYRSERDPLWDYLWSNAAGFDELLEALHRESLE